MKPLLFIASSSENLDIAYAAQANLEDVAEGTVWTQGILGLSKSILESLLKTLDESDFGLFVFAPDDAIWIRNAELQTTRDNVIFELGLFIGRLGRERCFIILPREIRDLHLPTDLLGITPATFELPSETRRLQAALGPASNLIRTEIRALGQRPRPRLDLSVVGSVARSVQVIDELTPEFKAVEIGDTREQVYRHFGIAVRKEGNDLVAYEKLKVLHGSDLENLPLEIRDVVHMYEDSMYRFKDRWKELYPKRAEATTDQERREIDAQIAFLVQGMKQELFNILDFLIWQGMDLQDHYSEVRYTLDRIAARARQR